MLLALPCEGEPRLQSGAFDIGKTDITLIDHSRTSDTETGTATAEPRVLDTSVWYPAQPRNLEWIRPGPAPLANAACPAPLVIYSHGFMSMRHNGAYLATYLASQGYIVAAADFPLTRFGTRGGPRFTDVLNQPGDISFIIDSLLDTEHKGLHDLAGCIDPQRIAAVGLSLGGLTTTLLAFHPELHDSRIAAAVSIAGPVALLGERFFRHAAPPYLVIAGDIDAMVDYRENVEALADWSPGTTIVTLHNGSHTGFAGIAAWLFHWIDNPDSIGCWAMRDKIDGQLEVTDTFMSRLRGQPDTGTPDTLLLPCRDEELSHALRPAHQQTLTRYSIYTFLQSNFDPDTDLRQHYRQLLEETLPAEYPALTVRGQAFPGNGLN